MFSFKTDLGYNLQQMNSLHRVTKKANFVTLYKQLVRNSNRAIQVLTLHMRSKTQCNL